MKLLDLFAGIGGFSLAAHWMGWETAAFVEWDKYCQKVLKKNFPNIPTHGDIREFDGTQYRGTVGIICGGFPCQPFSQAGKRKGAKDDRYLWPEMLRIINEVRPSWVVGENVAGILSMEQPVQYSYLESEATATQETEMVIAAIRRDLERIGYSVTFFNIPASATGAPHERQRVWIIANRNGENDPRKSKCGRFQEKASRNKGEAQREDWKRSWAGPTHGFEIGNTADAKETECKFICNSRNGRHGLANSNLAVGVPNSERFQGYWQYGECANQRAFRPADWQEHWLEVATRLCRVDDGLPAWVDSHRTKRLKALGNAIVPQVTYEIFKAIEQVNAEQLPE